METFDCFWEICMPREPDSLWAVSSLDGRYQADTEHLKAYVSEGALMGYRIAVEAAWLLHLDQCTQIRPLLNLSDAARVTLAPLAHGDVPKDLIAETKIHERATNHDVKAVEYVVRDLLKKTGSRPETDAWVHFACTSEDINNLSYALMLSRSRKELLVPMMDEICSELQSFAVKYKSLGMLSRTHGQTATPTTLGKEMSVFWRRLQRQKTRLTAQAIEGKINGATGNFNAHLAAFPSIDWPSLSKDFVENRLKLSWNPLTTQIEPHDSFVEFMEVVRMFNTILLDFSRDMWGYISLGYFAQKVVAGEVGSSTMPHKVNPIYFENAEGNLGVANSLLSHFGEKLPISRFQRDLSDSTVLRVTGTALGHTVLAWKSVLKGLSRVEVDSHRIARDLDGAWEVLGEAVQTVMRRYGVRDAYERLKAATRGQPVVTKDMILRAINECEELPEFEKERLRLLTPGSYTGLSELLVDRFVDKT